MNYILDSFSFNYFSKRRWSTDRNLEFSKSTQSSVGKMKRSRAVLKRAHFS